MRRLPTLRPFPNPLPVAEYVPVGLLYATRYSVLADMVTGWLKYAVCQPEELSLANVTLANCWPAALQRVPTWVPVLPADL
ncbi:hypothetical protein ARUL111621_08945 [Arthrobacter ulcerisalmonis]